MVTFWLTGLPSSGKTTTGDALANLLRTQGVPVLRIDGDILRSSLCSDLDLSPTGRTENVRRAGEVALMAAASGITSVISLISPMRADREKVRAQHAAAGCSFLEIWMDTPLEVCIARDPKGLWAKAAAGVIKNFTGLDAPYEPPKNPDLVLKPDVSPVCAADKLVNLRPVSLPVGPFLATKPVPDIKPLFLHHPMKCGGRALSASIRQACLDAVGITNLDGPTFHGLVNSGKPNIEVGPWIVSGPYQNFPFQSTHYPTHRIAAPEGYLRATVLRDPLARLVSLFRMYVAEHPNHPWWNLYDDSVTPFPEPTWRDFIEKTPKDILNHQTLMFSKKLNPEEAAEKIRALDIWWRSDTDMTGGLTRLASLMGLPSIPNIRFGEASKNPPAETLLSDASIMAIALELLAPDIELLRLLEIR